MSSTPNCRSALVVLRRSTFLRQAAGPGIRRYLPLGEERPTMHGFRETPCENQGVARVRTFEGELIVKMNPVEQFFALRRSIHVPLSLVHAVSVMDQPLNTALVREARMGFAARTAPGRGMICCAPRATWRGGQALLVVYGNRRSVVIELAESSPKWRLLVVSLSDPDAVAEDITGNAQPVH